MKVTISQGMVLPILTAILLANETVIIKQLLWKTWKVETQT